MIVAQSMSRAHTIHRKRHAQIIFLTTASRTINPHLTSDFSTGPRPGPKTCSIVMRQVTLILDACRKNLLCRNHMIFARGPGLLVKSPVLVSYRRNTITECHERSVPCLALSLALCFQPPLCSHRSEEHTSELQSLRHLVC